MDSSEAEIVQAALIAAHIAASHTQPKVGGSGGMAWVVGIGVFLLLLFAFPRQMGMLGALLLLVGAVAWGYFALENQARERQLERMVMTASYGNGCQSADYPIRVDQRNDTSKTIEHVRFSLEAFRPGYSSALASRYRSTDRILAPGETHASCWGVDPYDLQYGQLKGVDLSTLTWTVRPSSIRTSD